MSVASLDARLALRAVANGKAPAARHEELFVGRDTELALFDSDLDLVEAGGASLRIVVGEQGSGKTMLLQAMADRALARRFVTSSADLDPDCLLHGRGGEGRRLLRKTVLGMRTVAAGNEPAIDSIAGRFGNECRSEAETSGRLPRDCMRARLNELHSHPKGTEFGKVIQAFALAGESSVVATNARRWLQGDYSTLADARDELGVGSIVEDHDFWPMQKLWTCFVRLAGRPGFILFLDEARIICDLDNSNARKLNFEHLLMILNEVLQGGASGIGIIIAATPAFITEWRGMAKHEGLSSCLKHQIEQVDVHADSHNVLVHIQDLEEGDLVELLQHCRQLYASCHPNAPVLPDEGIGIFLETCRNRIGAARWRVPRTILQRFSALHDQMAMSPNRDWRELICGDSSDFDDEDMEREGYALRHM